MDIRVRIGIPLKEKVVGLYDIVNTPEYATVIGLISYYMRDMGANNYFLKKRGFLENIWFQIKNIISDSI